MSQPHFFPEGFQCVTLHNEGGSFERQISHDSRTDYLEQCLIKYVLIKYVK